MSTDEPIEKKTSHFIRDIIEEDLRTGKFEGRVHTRFPPEPNGYLHIGHAKAFLLSYGLATEFGGKFNLRFDDTNPIKEEQEYVDSIKADMTWLGVDWEDRELYASDYFGQLYEWAVRLIKKGRAYVDDLTAEEIREYRGTLTEPGKNSPHRDRSVEENLDLFERMKNGEFPDGSRTLRAKVDMSAGNMNLRDPVMYRILHASHHRTGGKWCIYPMYDWAHGQSDSIEGITHSICTLEFEDHRPLYDWFLNELDEYHPRQIEFARLNLNYTVMSKRRLLELVKSKYVTGWDDPRMPTIRGMRRLGYTPEAIRDFCERTGTAKSDSSADFALLEFCVREHLNRITDRVMAVLRPLKLVISNFPEGQVEELEAINNPEDDSAGTRMLPFAREIYIEDTDFMEDPPGKYFRLKPGGEVRLKHAYIVKCEEVVKDNSGNVTELHCSYDPETRSGGKEADRKVKGTLHWVSAKHAITAEVRLYDRLFAKENPNSVDKEGDYKENLNPNSLEVISGALVEPSLKDSEQGRHLQFLRHGYFCVDKDSSASKLVFNRTVSLRDTWAKIQKKG